ncbi:unnamed protein product [Zymoseptoria tritici ST99CH_1A5]|uniref:Uncharacterized protein n=3 Tax=Zymoseptoria tritici TaxID=1047171 RepID=A0A1X7RW00_ZYMT9|nr:unnamed protein product [Zymoseptoria tritici ST99CH_3D7]SMR53671.1 unnamed protein product [Zymoseptoria tritici ST99CH_1E4]SMY25205.1 unnamed protein product [Zymoseptoria tritici ST99CH_1A5]
MRSLTTAILFAAAAMAIDEYDIVSTCPAPISDRYRYFVDSGNCFILRAGTAGSVGDFAYNSFCCVTSTNKCFYNQRNTPDIKTPADCADGQPAGCANTWILLRRLRRRQVFVRQPRAMVGMWGNGK